MDTEQGCEVVFGPFRLDPTTNQLWRGEQVVALQPKPLAVLRYLAERPDQLVPKAELLKHIWVGVYVTKAVLKTCVQAIRKALGDDATAPCYIETVGREGYRFIAQEGSTAKVPESTSALASRLQSPAPLIVGREQELEQLQRWFASASHGERQLVFVTGEPGIGKTALVDLFQTWLRGQPQVWVGRGQCVEQYGEGEAYLPILEALGDLARGPGGTHLTGSLRRYAPTWLVQLPALVSEAERQAVHATVQGATRERRLREIADALEALSSHHPVILILEDLHWSDPSTVELLSALTQRRTPTRLFMIGTYRPAELVMGQHPLKGVKPELQAHGLCREMRVELLPKQGVSEYLARRFPQNAFPPELATLIHRRTEGNALFMVHSVEELVGQAIVAQDNGTWRLAADLSPLNIPTTVRQLIERQIERLGKGEQETLEVASVAGADFTVAAVAAALKQEIDTVEDAYEGVAWQGHFLEEKGVAEWPDGTVSGRYGFRHALYQNVLYERIAEARRVRLHRFIGERAEAGYGERAQEIAAELAVHFERGRDYRRAILYLQQAGENAIQRSAYQEATSLLSKGLELLKTLLDTPERTRQELDLQTTLSGALTFTKGYAAPEVEAAAHRMRELCQQVGETPQRLAVLARLYSVHVVRAEHQTALELAEQFFTLAPSVPHPLISLGAHYHLGWSLFSMGEFTRAREHQDQGSALYDPQQLHPLARRYAAFDCGIVFPSVAALTLWYLGYPEQALKKRHEALTLAHELAHPFSLAVASIVVASFHQRRREGQAVREQAEAVMALSSEQGFAFYLAWGTIMRGWALAEQGQGEEGIAQIRQGLAAYRATGAAEFLPSFLAHLAEAYGTVGQAEEGLRVLAEALAAVDRTGEREYEAELYRLKGELTLQQPKQVKATHNKSRPVRSPKSGVPNTQHPTPNPQGEAEAEACFHQAIEIAQKQQAKSLELRAVTSLARLWQSQGKQKEAHRRLAEVYNWFTEGFDTKDLQEAKALLDELV